MAETVGQHSVAAFTSPVNGTTPIDANTVRGNDNTVRVAYVDHDADPGIHVQSSSYASRPTAGTAGRKWITVNSGRYQLWYDDGSRWHEVASDAINVDCLADANLTKGDVVKVTGFNNGQNLPTVNKVSASTDVAFGVVENTVTSGNLVQIVNTGIIEDVATNTFSIGDILYPNTSGGFTATKPTSGSYQPCAYVLRSNANNGVLYVEFSAPRIVESSANTASTIVLRDASGDFSAGTITATAVNATTLDLTNLEVTNIKAKDGTQAIAIADATGKLTISDGVLMSGLTASQAVFTDSSKNLVSNAITGTGNVVMSASPTLTGTVTAATLNATTLGGTLSTAAQPNVTSVGTLTSLTTSGIGNFTLSGTPLSWSADVGLAVTRNGTTGASASLALSAGNTGAAFVYFGNSTTQQNGALYYDNSTNAMVFQTNGGSEKMRLDASGNLGLGVTPSAWGSTIDALQMGTATFAASATGNTPAGSVYVNSFFDGTNFKYVANGEATRYASFSGQHVWYQAASGTAGNNITFTQAMTLDASGNLQVGTTTSRGRITAVTTGYSVLTLGTSSTSSARGGAINFESEAPATRGQILYDTASDYMAFSTATTERARIDASGNLIVGDTSADYSSSGRGLIEVNGSSEAFYAFKTGGAGRAYLAHTGTHLVVMNSSNGQIEFGTNGTERARINSSGDFLVGKTDAGLAAAGISLGSDNITRLTTSGNAPLQCNRLSSDGDLVLFYQDTAQEGSISVSGNTVSYNAFAGSHWSQLEDGSKPEILRGTVMEALNELCEWPGEQNERLPKAKVSDTAGSKKVYGVFMDWDNDWTATNDMFVTAVGAFICRVAADVVVEQGDLLESNGDGTARVQADDVIRSSTIGKVTSTVKTHEYEDGTYCVPTVLYCG